MPAHASPVPRPPPPSPPPPSSSPPCLLLPYRAVGLVTDGVPFAVVQHGTDTFVTTATGTGFQTWSAHERLRQVFVGPPLPAAVSALCAHEEYTIACCGRAALVYRRADLLCTCDGGEHEAPIAHALTLGSSLVTVCERGVLVVWSLPSGEVVRRLHAGFAPTAMCHPATYLNKVVLGAPDGRVQIWNLRSGALVHESSAFGKPGGDFASAVMSLEQSPALDVVAIGFQSGKLVLHNLKFDEAVVAFAHERGDAVRALAFRSDGQPLLVSCGAHGSLYVWDLAKRTRVTSHADAHAGPISAAHFIRGTAEMITCGEADNALRVWIFDRPDGGARLLRERSGHSAPPTCVRFHHDGVSVGGGPAGQAYLISGGTDRTLRLSSIWSAQQDVELSQRREERKRPQLEMSSLERRLPAVVQISSSQVRERDWANCLTAHAGCSAAYCWDTTKKALAPHVLAPTPPSPVTAVAISSCGHFGFVGLERGAIYKYNLQSGEQRALTSKVERHAGAVRGIQPEGTAQCIFTGGADATLRTYSARDLKLQRVLEMGSAVAFLRHLRDSVLLAACCDDRSIQVVDTVTYKVVRRYSGHTNTLTDAAWSPDGRWLLSTSLDCTIRIVDVPSAQLIGWYSLSRPATSIALSPAGEYIATTHANTTAICVWANRSVFSSVLVEVAGDKPVPLEMPSELAMDDDDELDDECSGDEEGEEDEAEAEADERQAAELQPTDVQLHADMFTLSALPAAHWKTLLSLDVVKQRNKPVEPPKAPQAAPFFLPTLPGVERTFDPTPIDEQQERGPLVGGDEPPKKKTRMLQSRGVSSKSKLVQLLYADGEDALSQDTSEAVMRHLQSLSPSAVELELHSLSAEDDDGRQLALMIDFFKRQLSCRRDFELTQAFLAVFLKIHATSLASRSTYRSALTQLQTVQAQNWKTLRDLLHQDSCLLSFLSRAQS
ncbi:hypothetical protein AB1Y20_013794 [Prymnesium parvum]|uniref:Small-subunit processome Utp21 domain-containing protein n=1 Tax=Prymnesium parvum TaxID=97485 RepID=A0AB34IE91_PRYPA